VLSREVFAALPDLLFVIGRDGSVVDARTGKAPSTPEGVALAPALAQLAAAKPATATRALEVAVRVEDQPRSFEARLVPMDDARLLAMVRPAAAPHSPISAPPAGAPRLNLPPGFPDRAFLLDTTGRILDAHIPSGVPAVHSREQIIGQDMSRIVSAETAEAIRGAAAVVAETRAPKMLELRQPRGGSSHFFEARLSHAGDGQVLALIRDITARRREEDTRGQQRELYEALLKAQSDAGEAVIVGEGKTFAEWQRKILFRNGATATLSGYTIDEIDGMPSLLALLVPEERVVVAGRLQAKPKTAGDHLETVLLRKDGRRVPIEIVWKRFRAGARTGVIALVREITERARAREELEHRAFFDGLTRLPNRSLFQDRLGQALAVCRRSGASVGLLLLDLDRFKEINDTFGHAAGDGLLQEVAARFKAAFRETDTIARLGGDEFAFVLPGAHLPEAQRAAQRILKALEPPATVEGRMVEVGASIGIAICPEHGKDADVLLRCADVAMYTAKRNALGFASYEPSIDQHSAARVSMSAELRQGLEERQLVVHYQPQIETATGRVVCVEGLVRWQHPRLGLLLPSEFVPLAEEIGLIRPLLAFALEETLLQARYLRKDGWELPVAVNVSMRNLVDPELPELVSRTLARTGTPASQLELELTESAIMADARRATDILGRLRSMGVRLTIDDFGTGHSSLGYLHKLPLTAVKIDPSFITPILTEESSAAIVSSTIDLAHKLHFQVVAEGVETEPVLNRLREMGCDIAQGFHICAPLTSDALPGWLNNWKNRPPPAA
jgi:diguanylate cyclase (GGDEF)-like protein/PAS domain S-box-containing protein